MLSQMVEQTSQPWGRKARQPTTVCVWYSICQCARQVAIGLEKQQRKRGDRRRIVSKNCSSKLLLEIDSTLLA